MQAFTFFDYLYYNEFFDKLESVLVLNEDTEEYIYQNNKIQYPHDKLFKKVLDNKKEIVYFNAKSQSPLGMRPRELWDGLGLWMH